MPRLACFSTTAQRRGSRVRLAHGPALAVVAQGTGGFSGGGLAAELAVELLPSLLRRLSDGGLLSAVEHGPAPLPMERAVEVVRAAFARAGDCVRRAAELDDFLRGMATTATVAFLHEGQLVVGHVGDGRAYVSRNGALERLTEEHVLGADRRVLTRALGAGGAETADVRVVPVGVGDTVVLCTRALGETITSLDEALSRGLAAEGPDAALVTCRVEPWGAR